MPASNPFAMLLDSTAALQAHETALSSLRREVHKRADALPRHLDAALVEFDTAIDMAPLPGQRAAASRVRLPKAAPTAEAANDAAAPRKAKAR